MGRRLVKKHDYRVKQDKNTFFAKTWDDLRGKESATHYIDVYDDGYAWVNRKDGTLLCEVYLSTRTFYEQEHEHSSAKLQACGFNIVVESWD